MFGRNNTPATPSPERGLAQSAYDQYAPDLHHFLVRRLRRAQDVGDLMQEIFLRVLRLKRTELIRNPQAYLYGIAARVVRDYRARTRDDRMIFDSTVVQHRAEHPDHLARDALAEGIGLERQLEQALELLTPLQLQIFLLERCSRLTQPEIAARLNVSPHTVKKYAVQALAIVRLHCKQPDSMESNPS